MILLQSLLSRTIELQVPICYERMEILEVIVGEEDDPLPSVESVVHTRVFTPSLLWQGFVKLSAQNLMTKCPGRRRTSVKLDKV